MPGSAPKSDCAAAEEGDPCFDAPSLCPKDAPLTAIATTWFSNASTPCEVGTYCSVYIEALRVWALSVHLNNPCKRSVVLFMHQQQVIPTLLQEVISDYELRVERLGGELIAHSGTGTAKLTGDLLRTQQLDHQHAATAPFHRIVSLDADTVVLRPLEPLFRLPRVPVAMMHNVGVEVNTGVAVFTPSHESFEIVRRLMLGPHTPCEHHEAFTQSCWQKILLDAVVPASAAARQAVRGGTSNASAARSHDRMASHNLTYKVASPVLDEAACTFRSTASSSTRADDEDVCRDAPEGALCWLSIPIAFNTIPWQLNTPMAVASKHPVHVMHLAGKRKPWLWYAAKEAVLPVRVWWAFHALACAGRRASRCVFPRVHAWIKATHLTHTGLAPIDHATGLSKNATLFAASLILARHIIPDTAERVKGLAYWAQIVGDGFLVGPSGHHERSLAERLPNQTWCMLSSYR